MPAYPYVVENLPRANIEIDGVRSPWRHFGRADKTKYSGSEFRAKNTEPLDYGIFKVVEKAEEGGDEGREKFICPEDDEMD